MKKLSLFTVVASIFLLTSCTYRMTDFTIISTKNVDLSKAGQFKRSTARVEGKDVAHIVLSFGIGRPNMKEAIDRAIESTKGAIALVDGVVYSKWWWAILYGQSVIIVEGTPLIDPALTSMTDMPQKESFVFMSLDKNGKIKKQKEISSEEYNKIKSKLTKHAEKTTFKNSTEITTKNCP